jgi:hypothetical protein
MQVFGRPGWKDTKIRGIDQDLFNDGADANGHRPPLKKRAVEGAILSSADSASRQSSTPPVSGTQLMYTPKWSLFASQPHNGLDTVSSNASIETIPSSVFGGNLRPPPSSQGEQITAGEQDTGSIIPDLPGPSELTQTDFPDGSPMQVIKSLVLEQAGKSNPWVTQSPSLVLLNGSHSDGNFENWSVEDRPEERRTVWSHESQGSTKEVERSLFGWGSQICKY